MELIRVLHVVTSMNRGGIECMLMNYYRAIDRTKIQFDFLVHREEKAAFDDEIIALGGKIHRIPAVNPIPKSRYFQALDQFFEAHKEYKIVHSHINAFSLYPLCAAKKKGIPVRIAHSHTSSLQLNFKLPFKLYNKLLLNNFCTDRMACSQAAGNSLFGKDAQFYIVPNAIHSQEFRYNEEKRAKIRKALKLDRDEATFIHVGRFTAEKNHDFVIEIFKRCVEMKGKAKLLLIGDGPLRPKTEKKVKEAGLEEQVLFLGYRDNVADILQAADIFVFPSTFEGLGIAAIEAQAAGLRCVVSDILPGELDATELLYRCPLKSSAEVWAGMILNLLNYERQDMTENIIAKGLDITSQTQKMQEFYYAKALEVR